MPSGYNKAGPADNADSENETAFSATFIPTFATGQLIAVGTVECVAQGIASVRVEYKRQTAPPGTPWTPAGVCSVHGSGHVVVGPTTTTVPLNQSEAYDFRVVIQGTNTRTTETQDYFSITLLELEQPPN